MKHTAKIKSKYKGVYYCRLKCKDEFWQARIMVNGVLKEKMFVSERDAAVFYDKLRIEFGLEPVNILKRI